MLRNTFQLQSKTELVLPPSRNNKQKKVNAVSRAHHIPSAALALAIVEKYNCMISQSRI